MNIFFEKKIEKDALYYLLSKILNLSLKEIVIFEENYFFNNIDFEIENNVKCLCLYILVEGEVEMRVHIYRASIKMDKLIENVSLFLKDNSTIGSIYVENFNNEEFYLISPLSVDRVILSDEHLNKSLYKFDRIA